MPLNICDIQAMTRKYIPVLIIKLGVNNVKVLTGVEVNIDD